MGFELLISKKAQKDLIRLNPAVAARIVQKLKWFSQQNDFESFIVMMKKPSSGDFRFRIGDYRAISVIDSHHTKVTIISIGHRSDIYRSSL